MGLYLGKKKVSLVFKKEVAGIEGGGVVNTEDIVVNPTTTEQVVKRSSGKYINQVTVGAIQTEEKTVTENGEVTPTQGKFLTKVTVDVEAHEPVLQEKTATENGEVVPDDGYDGLSKVTVNVATSGGGTDRLQLKCDQTGSLQYEFSEYGGSSVSDILNGLDFSGVKKLNRMCYECYNLEEFPRIVVPNATTISEMFRLLSNSPGKLTTLDLSGVSGMGSASMLTYSRSGLQRIILPLGFKPTSTSNMCANNSSLTELVGLDEWDLSEVTEAGGMFSHCSSLAQEITLNMPKCKDASGVFSGCSSITAARLLNSGNATTTQNIFYNNYKLVTAEADLRSSTNAANIVFNCRELVNLTLKNIRTSIQIGRGSGTSVADYGTNINQASTINTAKELWDLTGGTSKTLTIPTGFNERFDTIYVKLITATDEMIAQDPYINNKKPCEVCESTDEGAMTLREYAVSKNWALARG